MPRVYLYPPSSSQGIMDSRWVKSASLKFNALFKVSGVIVHQKHECVDLCLTFKRNYYNPIVNTHMFLTSIDCRATPPCTFHIFSPVQPTAIYTRSYKIISNRYDTTQDRHNNFVGCVKPTAPKISYPQLHYIRVILRH